MVEYVVVRCFGEVCVERIVAARRARKGERGRVELEIIRELEILDARGF